ncbi:Hypothetical protein SRAE_1000223600 [Strongyloides ratti]|uniref:G-protein coupled receptors family 1 profile domain-containing protein n=1 Tax=Strongyloides ratti TaxID=34506 RepID=A0A090L8Y1_STRRB|nr:Hypothetical protein SRAE_1000223600 [Strongyloides ratti]CEF63980.1 Hypothetical protein SRAE_1000223600 [Strongyloides ratti]
MSNITFLLTLSEEYYPINKGYYTAAIQYEISMAIVLLPNIYFLYITLSESVFKKRPSLKKTILTFSILNITYIITNLIISSYYLNGYLNNGLIKVNTCYYIRRIQMLLMTFLVTIPLVFTVHRYFTVFSKNNYQNYICLIVFIISNFPSFTLFSTLFITSNVVWTPDEICTFIRNSASTTINNIIGLIYYFTLGVPLIVGIINLFLIRRLNTLTVTSSAAKCNRSENKTIFVNLLIQTIQPFIGQWPSILFYFYLVSTKNNIYVVWRILDGLTAISLVSNILFSIIFIKEVRNVVFRRIGINHVSAVINVVTMTHDNGFKSPSKKTIAIKV